MKQISKLELTALRELSTQVAEIFFSADTNDNWDNEIKALFSDFDTADVLDQARYVPDPTDEDGFPEWYGGFIEELNSMAVTTVEDVEAKIIHFASVIDLINGDVEISIPDYVSGDYNIPTGVNYI